MKKTTKKEEPKQHNTHLMVPETLWKKIVARAAKDTAKEGKNVSAAQVIRDALDFYL